MASAAMDGAGRWQPMTLRSSESTADDALHVTPPSAERAERRRALLSGRTAHHTATSVVPLLAARSDPGHAAVGGTRAATRADSVSVAVSPEAARRTGGVAT